MFALSQGARDQYIAKLIQECSKSKYYLLFLSKVKHWHGLLIFREVILLSYRRLRRFVLMREIGLEAGTLAGFAGVLCHGVIFSQMYIIIQAKRKQLNNIHMGQLFRSPAFQDVFNSTVELVEVVQAGPAFQLIGIVQIAKATQSQDGHTRVAHFAFTKHDATLRQCTKIDAVRILMFPCGIVITSREHAQHSINYTLFPAFFSRLLLFLFFRNDDGSHFQGKVNNKTPYYKTNNAHNLNINVVSDTKVVPLNVNF